MDIHGFSKHFGTDEEYNETNPGLGIAHGTENFKGLIGFYKNSYSDQSYYLGVELLSSGMLRVGVVAGGIYGYKKEQKEHYATVVTTTSSGSVNEIYFYRNESVRIFMPAFAPILEFGGAVSLRATFIPASDSAEQAVLFGARVYF